MHVTSVQYRKQSVFRSTQARIQLLLRLLAPAGPVWLSGVVRGSVVLFA